MPRLISFLVVLGLAFTCGHSAYAQSGLRAGAASAVVNPPIGSYIAGDALNRTFTGVQDDLFAKAAVFSDGDEALAIVTMDCLGLGYPQIKEIQRLASEKTTAIDLPSERIVISSDHIHSGPDVVGIYGPDHEHSGVDRAYMARLKETMASVVAEAAAKLTAVTGRYATAMHDYDWVRNVSEPGELDRSITTLQFLAENGEAVVTLTNFACHPTFLDAVHSVVSADYVGGYYRAMAKDYGGEHLFLQGAIGGWVQPDKGDRSFALAYRRGAELAADVKAALGDGRPLAGSEIRFNRDVIDLPAENEAWTYMTEIGVIDRELGDTISTEVIWFAIGSAEFVTHPGETPPAYSLATKEMMETAGPKFVMGLGMDALGYVNKPDYFAHPEKYPNAEYLNATSLGPKTGPLLLEAWEAVILED